MRKTFQKRAAKILGDRILFPTTATPATKFPKSKPFRIFICQVDTTGKATKTKKPPFRTAWKTLILKKLMAEPTGLEPATSNVTD
jgi:hypothetical protein